jgi:hypothetical protein
MSLPAGYDTIVREQGNNFSAGQRQRLAIARAFLRDAPILIVDEPTANLDVEAEAEVMHALNTLISGRTVLMISHRLSTLGNVDEILVLSAGQIIEQGAFQELKHQGGFFAHLLEEQNRYNLDREEDDKKAPDSLLTGTSPYLPAVQVDAVSRPLSPSFAVSSLLPVAVATIESLPGDAQRRQYNGHGSEALTENDLEQDDVAIPAHILVEVDGKTVGEYRLEKRFMTIGRSPTNDIQIAYPSVSRLHAIIRWKNGTWIIEDAASMNGLSYHGQRVDQLALANGEGVLIDPGIVLRYEELVQVQCCAAAGRSRQPESAHTPSPRNSSSC